MDLNIVAATTSSTNSSFLSILYQHSQSAFGQLFSVFNKDWIKGRHCSHGVTVQTRNGPVRGKTFTLLPTGQRVNAFLGIPYARAGTFQDRFKKAFPVKPWQKPLDCTRFGPRAVQYDMFWDIYLTPIPQDEENCLHISVFSPDWESVEFGQTGRPVMVFVHGGGFLIHSSANYGDWNFCQNLCLHDVVVCVVQYRLGMLGFLSTGDERCSGNFGLWDQLSAFQWVKENIATFGGDPNNVTAFGQSAGAASIDLLSLSPLTKGLFKRIILMGGNASTDWAIVSPERTQKAAIRLARRAGWKGSDTDLDSLLAFLRSLPPHRVSVPLVGKSAFNRHRKGLEFCPVIDGHLIPGPVEQLRREIDWPLEVIVGGTEMEALLFLALGRRQCDLLSMRKYLQIYIPSETMYARAMRKHCEQLYLKGVNTADPMQVSTAFLRLHSDLMINNSVQRYCQQMLYAPSSDIPSGLEAQQRERHKIYLYNMIHFNRDEFGFIGLRMPFYAATHCHDLRYLIGKGLYSKFRPNWDDKQMMRIIGSLFTNFAKYGNPNAHWRQHPMAVDSNTDENSCVPNDKNLSEKTKCCPPWMANAEPKAENAELFEDGTEECNWWLPITSEDTYRHFELSLEPRMRPDYQGKRFEFWRNEQQLLLEKEGSNNDIKNDENGISQNGHHCLKGGEEKPEN